MNTSSENTNAPIATAKRSAAAVIVRPVLAMPIAIASDSLLTDDRASDMRCSRKTP
jgi:hypothetical protein